MLNVSYKVAHKNILGQRLFWHKNKCLLFTHTKLLIDEIKVNKGQ
jgi:hypothetical protein